METLEKIFGSSHKVKIMRLFLFNPSTTFDIKEIVRRTKTSLPKVRKEMSSIEKAGLVKSKIFSKESNLTPKRRPVKRKLKGWVLNKDFSYLIPLQNFLVHISGSQQKEIIERIKKIGTIKLLVLSGVFIQEWESRVDILIVGDKLRPIAVENAVSWIESEVGKEINYCFFETSNFLYRLGVCDKLVRDILDYPHKKIINKLDLN